MFIGNGKAIALGEPEGMVKTVFDRQTGACRPIGQGVVHQIGDTLDLRAG